ncbi:response regulator [Brevibacillus dissolubilis]|uniref:response regulator n=1 Tax=Brevibacillus dissolubilis TaxID=1844116 RepID=UPI00111634BA|nr:response regulator [Brevibacillus dissolubilis]
MSTNTTRHRVVLIEDDPMVQEVNRMFIEKVTGFEVIGIAGNGVEGVKLVQELQPDLVVMDIYMPAQNGMETLQQLRTANEQVDVIVITAAKDTATIQHMLRYGARDYIIKPFKFERIQQALENYAQYREQLQPEGELTQDQLDGLLNHANSPQPVTAKPVAAAPLDIPKGLNEQTLSQVMNLMTESSTALTAEAVAEGVGIARVTARRYLEYLESLGKVQREIRYGGVGRPTHSYIIRRG